jgi:hypothetical protein
MAISSTSFMSAGVWGSALLTKLDKVDCSQVLSAVLVADRELLGHISMGPPAENIEANWIEDELVGCTFFGWCSGSASIYLEGFSTSNSVSLILRPYSILQAEGEDWYFQVASIVTNATVHGGSYGLTSGSFSTVSTSTLWRVVGSPYTDSADASPDVSSSRAKRRNFTQIFESAVEISQTRKGMSMEAIVDELQTQIKYRTLEQKRQLDMAVISGVAYASGASTKSPDVEYRTMQGIIKYIRDYDMDNTNEDDLVTNVAGALTIEGLNGLLYKIFDAGGLDEMSDPIIVVGGYQQRVIASWEKELRRVEQGERQVGYYRDVFMSDMGKEFPVVMDKWVPKQNLIVLDRARVSLRALVGDAWHMEKMAKTGRSEKWQISGQYTIEVRNADKCHGLLRGLT